MSSVAITDYQKLTAEQEQPLGVTYHAPRVDLESTCWARRCTVRLFVCVGVRMVMVVCMTVFISRQRFGVARRS